MEQPAAHTIMVISDIHGNRTAFSAVQKRLSRDHGDLLLIAGDIAPRYSEGLVGDLNALSDRITAVHGNCDTPYDQQLLRFPLPVYQRISFSGRTIFLTHGDQIRPSHPPLLSPGDIFISGHTHTPSLYLQETSGIFMLNPGSVTSPRGGTAASYAVITASGIEIRELYRARRISSITFDALQ
jgi:uncharacterized protein